MLSACVRVSRRMSSSLPVRASCSLASAIYNQTPGESCLHCRCSLFSSIEQLEWFLNWFNRSDPEASERSLFSWADILLSLRVCFDKSASSSSSLSVGTFWRRIFIRALGRWGLGETEKTRAQGELPLGHEGLERVCLVSLAGWLAGLLEPSNLANNKLVQIAGKSASEREKVIFANGKIYCCC